MDTDIPRADEHTYDFLLRTASWCGLAAADLAATMPRLDVPIVLAPERLDQVAPGQAAHRFGNVSVWRCPWR